MTMTWPWVHDDDVDDDDDDDDDEVEEEEEDDDALMVMVMMMAMMKSMKHPITIKKHTYLENETQSMKQSHHHQQFKQFCSAKKFPPNQSYSLDSRAGA